MSFPFSPYDFFGYLAAGFIVIGSIEYSADKHWLIDQELKVTTAVFWIGAAYIIGHIIANISSYFVEHKMLRGVIGGPEELLFTDEPRTADRHSQKNRIKTIGWWLGWINPVAWWRWAFPVGWRRAIFPIYCKPLPMETRARVLKRSSKEGFSKPGRALFYHCHALVKRDKTAFDRMTSFLNLYGFCRNICMAALIAAVILFWGASIDLRIVGWRIEGAFNGAKLWWAGVALAVAIGMMYRYLKFFRHYTIEVFVTYAELAEPKLAEQA